MPELTDLLERENSKNVVFLYALLNFSSLATTGV